MRNILALLSLLLIPLCSANSWNDVVPRLSSYSVVGTRSYFKVEEAVIPYAELEDDASKERLRDLREQMFNTLYAVSVDVYDRWNTTEAHYIAALFNGFRCEFSGDYEQEITRILYGEGTVQLTEQQRAWEEKQALAKPIYFNCSMTFTEEELYNVTAINDEFVDNTTSNDNTTINDNTTVYDNTTIIVEINDTTTTAYEPFVDATIVQYTYDECFCAEGKVLLYCLMRRMEQRINEHADGVTESLNHESTLDVSKQMKKCPAEAIASVADFPALASKYGEKHFGMFGRYWDNMFDGNDTVDHITHNEARDVAQLFCESIDAAASEAVRGVFSADAYYFTIEHQLYTVWGPARMDVNAACRDDENFATADFGKCVCARDRGFSFCIWHVLGEYFKRAGYLDCSKPGNEHFNGAKKPATIPALGKIGARLVPPTTAKPHQDEDPIAIISVNATTPSINTVQTESSAFALATNRGRRDENEKHRRWIVTLMTFLQLLRC